MPGQYEIVSIHAPAWGATISSDQVGKGTSCFNSRARMGRDARHDGDRGKAIYVSIHAPAWGATRTPRLPRQDEDVSIHAPAWGATAVLFFTIIALFFVLYFAKPKKGLRFQGPKTLWSIISHYYC